MIMQAMKYHPREQSQWTTVEVLRLRLASRMVLRELETRVRTGRGLMGWEGAGDQYVADGYFVIGICANIPWRTV